MQSSSKGVGVGAGSSVNNINNLNIVTFIKDIYQSLKHIDQSFSMMKTDIDARMSKLEMNQQVFLERIANLESFLNQINNRLVETEKMDKSLENELLDKMFILNRSSEADAKIELKPKELTIANIIENGYTMLDINNTIEENNYKPLEVTDDSNSLVIGEPLQKPSNLDSLLFD